MTREKTDLKDRHPSTSTLVLAGVFGTIAADYLLADQSIVVIIAFWSILALLGSAVMMFKRSSEPGGTAVVACIVGAIGVGSASWHAISSFALLDHAFAVAGTIIAVSIWSVVMTVLTTHAFALVLIPCTVLFGALSFSEVSTLGWQHFVMYALSAASGIAVLAIACNPRGYVWGTLDEEDRAAAMFIGVALIAVGPLTWRIFQFEDIDSDAIEIGLILLCGLSAAIGLAASLRLRVRNGFSALCYCLAAACGASYLVGPDYYATAAAGFLLLGMFFWLIWEWLEQSLLPTGLIGPSVPDTADSTQAPSRHGT